MPFYNHPEMVEVMIDSIRANDYHDWELLAMDDGSESAVLQALMSRYASDNRIRFIRREREPKGAQTCRNLGLEMARGEYIIFFDSDDAVTPSCLSGRVSALQQQPDKDFLVFPAGILRNGSLQPMESKNIYGYPIYKDDIAAFAQRTLPFIVWTNIYRTASLKSKHLTWDVNLSSFQDSDFNIQALLSGLSYAYVTAPPDYAYRIVDNDDSVSKKGTSGRHRKSHAYFLDKQYSALQGRYGHKYDRELYRCALCIYQITMATAVDKAYARQLIEIVSCHDKLSGRRLRLKVGIIAFLEHLLPNALARKLVMADYLSWRRNAERKTAHAIKSLRIQ